jgi:MYXO-CTERM domain-containing protein
MARTIFSTLALTLALAGLAAPAFADVAPTDPCDGKKSGDACTTDSGDDGTCQSTKSGGLSCEADSNSDSGKGSGCTFASGAPATGGLVLVAAAAALSALRRRRR